MSEPYEDISAYKQALRRGKAQAAADWEALSGPFGGVISRLRARGRAARRNAWVFLCLLLLTVLAGLGYYLLLPFWESSVDNREETLTDTLAGIEEEEANLDRDRNALIDRDGSEEDEQPGLATLLRGQFSRLPVPGSQSVWFRGAAKLPEGGLLIYGSESTLLRLPANGDRPEQLEVPGSQSVWFRGAVELPSGGLLVVGDKSTLLRLPANGGRPEQLEVSGSQTVDFRGTAVLPEGGLLIYGSESTLLRLPAEGGAPERLEVPGSQTVIFRGAAKLPDGGLLVYGDKSTLLRLPGEGGAPERLEVPGSQTVAFRGAAKLPDGGLLVVGSGGTLLRLPADGGAPKPLALLRGPVFIGAAALPDGGLLVYGTLGALVRLPAEGGAPEWLELPGPPVVQFLGTAELPDGELLVYGSRGTLLRLPAEGGTPELMPVPSQGITFYGTAELPDGELLVYGSRGTLLRRTDRWSEAALKLEAAAGAAGDATLDRFLDDTLPAHLRDWPPVAEIRAELTGIGKQRAALEILRARTEDHLEELDEFPYAQWRRTRLRLDFAGFLDTCRGPDNSGAEITAACLDAWQERQASADSWWQTLANQVPPGILILFLLATTGALYRYNLRLAGFHDSRADALELLARGRSDAELRDILATSPGEAVNLATVFLAADKVEQGTIRAKLGQAEVELAKALGTDR